MLLRSDSVLRAVTLLVAAGLIQGCSEDRAQRPRNVLIIALDTLRPDHLGCYGYARPTSPALDEFARTGIVFDDAQSSAPWTAPSLITVMTGLEPEVHQVIDSPNPGRMSPSVTTLAEILKEKGFATAAFTEGGYAKGQFGLDQGFDEYPANVGETADDHAIEAHESRLAANLERTLTWLREPRDKPFLLFFHTYEVHSPFRAPASFVRAFRPGFDADGERAELLRIITTWNEKRAITREDCAFFVPRAMLLRTHAMWKGLPEIQDPAALTRAGSEYGLGPKHFLDQPEMLQLARDLYDAGIASADRGIEKLLAQLRALGLDKDTLVVIVSDHGEGLGEHSQMEHGYVLNDEILHVVLLMRIPSSDVRPRHVPDLVSLADVVPTVLDVMGIDAAKHVFQGRSLLPSLRGELPAGTVLAHGRTMARSTDELYSLRSGKWRCEVDLRTKATVLYDLQQDPHELRNVAPDNPQVVIRMTEEILRHHVRNLALQKAVAGDVSVEALDPQTLKELRQFGYAGDDPKEH